MADAGCPSYVADSVFNVFVCYTAIMSNSVTIHAIRKTSSLPKPLKTLLLSLAVSDLGVGLLVLPLRIALLIMKLEPNAENNPVFSHSKTCYLTMMNLLYYTAFFGVTALTVDRFLAIHLHLRYQELVTHKRVVAVVISMWVFGAIISLVALLVPARKDRYIVFASIEVFCLITTALLFYKLYLAVRHHANQIDVLQVQQEAQNGEMANAARLKQSAVGTFYVYLVFLVCYLPMNCIYCATFIAGWSTTVDFLSKYNLTPAFLTSSLNPLIYCWKMRHIRRTVMDILQKSVITKSQLRNTLSETFKQVKPSVG